MTLNKLSHAEQDCKLVIRCRKSKKDMADICYEEFGDTKYVIRIRASKKNRQHNGQKKKDKQRSTKHTHKTKDRIRGTPLETGGELRCSGRVSSSSSTSGTRHINLVTNPVISHEWGKDREVVATSGKYPWSFVTQIYHNGQPSHGGNHTKGQNVNNDLYRQNNTQKTRY